MAVHSSSHSEGIALGTGDRRRTGIDVHPGHARVGVGPCESERRTQGSWASEGWRDGQSAAATTVLPEKPAVIAQDLNGAKISGVEVEFEALDGGTAIPGTATTDSLGEAGTNWVLGLPTGPQALRATVGEYAVEFTATATDPPLAIPPGSLPRGRLTVPYRKTLDVRGGTGSLFWSLEAGSLPAGLALDTTGVIVGTPTEIDSPTFTVHVRDAEGNEASREMELRVPLARGPSTPYRPLRRVLYPRARSERASPLGARRRWRQRALAWTRSMRAPRCSSSSGITSVRSAEIPTRTWRLSWNPTRRLRSDSATTR